MYGHKYTAEEKSFFESFVPGHTYKEIQEAFSARFGWDISVSQVKGYMGNNKLSSGTLGHFKKGHVPANKGQKGVCAAGCEKGWFSKGHTPATHKPVGTESFRTDKSGAAYTYVKIKEPNVWKMKHVLVWEQHNGPVPKGKIIIFLDGNTQNTDIENMAVIDRGTHAVMNHMGLRYNDAECTEVAVNVAELSREISKAKKR